MEPSKTKTVCFTGHRPKGIIADRPYDESNRPVYQKIVDGLTVSIERLIDQGYTNFISGGAQGFDQLAFWAVNIVKARRPEIQNIVYKPFNGQESRWAKTGLFSQHEYDLMLKKADQVYVCDKTVDTADFKSTVKALMYRNKCMVNASDHVIGQFENDSWADPRTKSGTADCLRYAKQMGKTIQIFQ